MNRVFLSFMCTVALAASGFADNGGSSPLRDIYGADHRADEFLKAPAKAAVFVILDENCPVVRQQLPKLIRLYEKYNGFEKDRGGFPKSGAKFAGEPIPFLGVYVKEDASAKEVALHALSESIPFRILRDIDLSFVKNFEITRLSEVLVLSPEGNLIYRGPVDDQVIQGSAKPAATHSYLETVLDQVASGTLPASQTVPAVGCLINTKKVREPLKVTYHSEIKNIIDKNCVPCHQPGAVGPMELTTYDEIVNYASMIEEVVLEERMPPWPVASSRELHNPLALSPNDRMKLLGWLRTDLARGEPPADAPKKGNSNPKHRWSIPEPNFVFEMPEPYRVPATGYIDYVYIPIEINGGKGFPEDRWIEAIEVVPGVKQVVHHIQVHEFQGEVTGGKIDPIQQLLLYGLSVENARLIGSYTPGNLEENARNYSGYHSGSSRSAAMKLRKGSNLILEMHYTPNGKEALDRSAVGIRFADQAPDTVIETWFPFRKRPDLVIPTNLEHHTLQDRYHFGSRTDGKAILLYGVRPHLHTRGKSFRLELIDSNAVNEKQMQDFSQHGKIRGELLLALPVWDFNWQHFYRFEKPILIPPNKAILATAAWDNSKFNPRNPDATKDVPWGQQTIQEMFNTLFIYEVLEANDPRLALNGGVLK